MFINSARSVKLANTIRPRRSSIYDSNAWGWMPTISLIYAAGLLMMAVADILSSQGFLWAEALFWVSLVTLTFPIVLRLTSMNVSRKERIVLLILFGLSLYTVKVMHSPYRFTFSDEYVHEYNALQILQSGHLFSDNPIINVTPFYPGLEILTSAIASLSGLSIFISGLIVIGLARLILILSLFLFYEQISGSSRHAGIATIVYACNSNFLFWSAQFSYESLALPLAFMVLFIIAKRDSSQGSGNYWGFSILALLGIAVTVFSHHLSSYFLSVFLLVWAIIVILHPLAIINFFGKKFLNTSFINLIRSRFDAAEHLKDDSELGKTAFDWRKWPGWLAIVALLLSAGWLTNVATHTIDYIVPVSKAAYLSIVNTFTGTEDPRILFQSKAGYVAPLWQRIVGLASVVLLVAGMPFGLREFWRTYKKNRLIHVFAVMGLVYFGFLGMRFVHAAWEVANRVSEYLFVGLAFLLAIGGIEFWSTRWAPWLGKAIFTTSMCVILLGGIISGWPPKLVLQQPSQVKVGDAVIEPQGWAVAKWFLTELGPGNRIGADTSNARLLLTYGHQLAYEGKGSSYPNLHDIMNTSDFPEWQKRILWNWSIRYLVMDRREISRDNMAGYFFDRTVEGQHLSSSFIDQNIYNKFYNLRFANRILDSGNISVYDFLRFLNVYQ